MLGKLFVSFALLAALIPSALGKTCLYHFDQFFKTIFAWDAYVQDFNVCNYWNWHYFNLPNFTSIRIDITGVCYKPDYNEMGFLMGTPLDQAPDRVLMPDGGECGLVVEQHMSQYLASLGGWTCLNKNQLYTGCMEQGIPLYGL
ncbi:hypothetical protein HDU96_001849 [Phlyctochytrium bullatum]|nr:hypothetical protein HDU96_001849 [Phlyctochytrium bullatum]